VRTAALSLAPVPLSAREARRFLRTFLAEAGEDGVGADGAELALSEIVTNAVLHAHTELSVSLRLGADRVLRAEVRDGNPALPVQRDYAAQATTGRGMELVAAYVRDCGVRADGADGKTVWFEVDLGARPPEPTEQELLDAWDIDLGDPAPADGGDDVVVLLSLPPTLWLAAREHHDAVLRELALLVAEHPDDGPTGEQLALADRARGWVSTRVVEQLGRLDADGPHRVLPDGHPSPLPDAPSALDLDVPVPAEAGEAFAALQDVLDVAEALAAKGRLLARPALPEIVAVRDWACEQGISQRRGIRATPWPGTSQERFTGPDDRDGSASLDWDTRLVSDSERGAVAADESNRLLAISRSLADALGWRPDDLVGRRVVVLIPPELREAHVAGFTRHLTTGEAHAIGVPLRLPVLRADGTTVDCDFLIEQTPLASGRAVYVAWIEPVA
jgi:PAS domain S-box-containing protein